jgi:hypothetical protein
MDSEKTVQQQQELLGAYQQASRRWQARTQSEIALWVDLGSKLAKTRSVPEAFEAYGKCVSQQMQMTAEDAQHLLNDWQHITQSLMTNGWWPKGPA